MSKIMPKKLKSGQLIPNGVKLELQEMDTILFYTNLGKNIELVIPSNTPGNKRPDCFMDGLEWEIKSPVINTKKAVERMFYRAATQSESIIMDLRRLKGSSNLAVQTIMACFLSTRKVRRLHIIDRNGKLSVHKK